MGRRGFRDPATLRSGEQASIGADLMALMDALAIPRAVFAGYDWGGRAACIGAALWPERCTGLVCVNSYLIQDIASAMEPAQVRSARCRSGTSSISRSSAGAPGLPRTGASIAADPVAAMVAELAVSTTLACERTAVAHDNPDYVDVVIHSYRHRYGLAEGDPRYADIQRRLAALPPITVPAITLDGDADGVVPATDGKAQAREIHRPPRPSRHSARRPQSAAGRAGGVCGGGDGVDQRRRQRLTPAAG